MSRFDETDFNDDLASTEKQTLASSALPAITTAPLRSLQQAISNNISLPTGLVSKEKEKETAVRTQQQQQQQQHFTPLPVQSRNTDGIEAVNITNTRSALNLTSSISMLFSAVNRSLSGALSSVLSLQPQDIADRQTSADNGNAVEQVSRIQSPTNSGYREIGFSRAVDQIIEEKNAVRNNAQCIGRMCNIAFLIIMCRQNCAKVKLFSLKPLSYCSCCVIDMSKTLLKILRGL